MDAPWRLFSPLEDGVSQKGFTEKVLLMPNLDKWVGFIS